MDKRPTILLIQVTFNSQLKAYFFQRLLVSKIKTGKYSCTMSKKTCFFFLGIAVFYVDIVASC